MGILDLFKSKEKRTTAENWIGVDDPLLKALLSKDTITVERSLAIPAVAEAVHRIATMVAVLPIKLYTKDSEKGDVPVKDDDRVFLLNTENGDTLDQFSFKRNLAKDYLLDKGAFIYIQKKDGDPEGLRYIPPAKLTSVVNDVNPLQKDGQYRIMGKAVELWDVVAILRDTDDGIIGTPLTYQINDVLSTALNTILYELGIAKKGGATKGFLQSEKELSPDAMQALKTAWANLYGGSVSQATEENVVVLNKGVEFKEASHNARDMQTNERRTSLAKELKALFGIHSDNFDDFFRDAVLPVLEAIESALNKTLLKEDEKKTHYFAFDKREILKAELKTRYDAYKTASETGWLSKNEIRELENLQKIDGLDVMSMGLGDVLYDINSKTYYTPNTGDTKDFNDQTNKDEESTK